MSYSKQPVSTEGYLLLTEREALGMLPWVRDAMLATLEECRGTTTYRMCDIVRYVDEVIVDTTSKVGNMPRVVLILYSKLIADRVGEYGTPSYTSEQIEKELSESFIVQLTKVREEIISQDISQPQVKLPKRLVTAIDF